MAAGDILRFVDGSEFRITKSAADTSGEYLEMEGGFEVFVGDRWQSFRAGETASVPAGTVHTFRVGDQHVRVRNVHAPALDFEDYFALEAALMQAGKIKSYSSPRAALHYAVILDRYRHCMVMASPPLRGLIRVLAPLGRRLGFGLTA